MGVKIVSISFGVFLLLFIAGVIQIAAYGPLLPDRVASHYGPDGRPDRWSPKDVFIATYVVVLVLAFAFFVGLGFFVQRVPPYFIHIPRREYWMTRERQQATRNTVIRHVFWFASATMAFYLVTMNLAMQVSMGLSEGIRLSFTYALAGYGIATILWGIGFNRRFRLPEEEGRDS
ncbi:MAG: DUF1648 domain-containing protein [Candidatus Eisenbacteria bacterium]